MKYLFFLIVAAVMSGCAGVPQQGQAKTAPTEIKYVPAPVCQGAKECEAMWMDSQETIQMVVRMKLRLAGENRVETFASRNFGMAGAVVKYPIGDDRYEMRADITCRNRQTCGDLIPLGINLFNEQVTSSATLRKALKK